MDLLTSEAAEVILRHHGAQRVTFQRKASGRFMGLLAYFYFRDVGHVWKIRADGYVQNFMRDVERELA